MATIKPSMNVDKINSIFEKYRNITFKAGTYNITKMMTVHSGTTVTCEPGVIFTRSCRYQMLEMAASEDVLGYNGTHDVIWDGGTFLASEREEDAIVIVLYHCKNITLKNIVVDGCRGYHSIECNSSQNVHIMDCTFKNQSSIPDAEYREAIQIDFAYQLGYPYRGSTGAPANDGTHCKDIFITNCTFDNVPNGIGTHTVYEVPKYHENIMISDCTFRNIERNGIQLLSMKDVTITNCPTHIELQKRNKGFKLDGTKVKMDKTRYNVNVSIDNLLFE